MRESIPPHSILSKTGVLHPWGYPGFPLQFESTIESLQLNTDLRADTWTKIHLPGESTPLTGAGRQRQRSWLLKGTVAWQKPASLGRKVFGLGVMWPGPWSRMGHGGVGQQEMVKVQQYPKRGIILLRIQGSVPWFLSCWRISLFLLNTDHESVNLI